MYYSVCILINVFRYLYSYLLTDCILWLAAGGTWAIRDAPVHGKWVNKERHLESAIEWVWRLTWLARWSEFSNSLAGPDLVSLQINLKGNNRQNLRRAWRRSCWRESSRRYDECWDFIHHWVNSQLWECNALTFSWSSRWELTGGSQSCSGVHCKLKLYPSSSQLVIMRINGQCYSWVCGVFGICHTEC